jgi:hypothetical protein
MKIPIDPIGYAVNENTGTIHTRYADHGNGTRTRTVKGVETLLNGKKGTACKLCYPSPHYDTPAPSSEPPKRRVPDAAAVSGD